MIVVDRAGAGGKVRLNYLVTDATWRPQYRFRAGAEKDRGPARISGGHRAEVGRRLDGRGHDAFDRPAAAQRDATGIARA